MPKGKPNRKKNDEVRYDLSMRLTHLWKPGTFNTVGRPVAHCGEQLFPKSIKFIDIEPKPDVPRCGECYGS